MLDILWNTDETEDRLNDIVGRRIQRDKAGRSNEAMPGQDESDQPLSHEFVTGLLQSKYQERWARLQLNDPSETAKSSGIFSDAPPLNHSRHPPPDDD